ncbi:MAG: Smr/MutS family protein [Bacteroidia bacterium]
MSKFKPGDKVQLLNENLKGTITGQAGSNRWMVEIEDGFEIPLEERELVSAGGDEAEVKATASLEAGVQQAAGIKEEEAVLLIFRKGDKENELRVYLVNQLPCALLFTLHFNKGNTMEGFAKSEIGPNSHLRLGLLNMQNFDLWSHIEMHGLIFAPSPDSDLPLSFQYSLNMNARKFIKSLSTKNPFNEEAHVFKAFGVENAKPATEATEERKVPKIRVAFTLEAPSDVVDLHIEKLVENPQLLSPAEMLQQQMAYFDACLERAIALNYEKITFIHGAGQGILKNKIRSALVKVKEVRKIRDANPELYGGGATEVIFG